MLKGLIAAGFGILLGTSGIHGNTSAVRFAFDQAPLAEGLPVIVVSLGAFAFPEILDLTVTGKPVASSSAMADVNTKEVLSGFRYGLRQWKQTIRQSLFGVFMGAIPGIGSSVVDWLAYGFGIAFTKDKSEFGKGSLDGVLFAESAQNSKEAGQAIPTLAVGIPGGLTWVFVLVGMLSYGIAPGPEILRLHADLVITIVVAFAVGNFLVAALGVVMTGTLAKVTLIPYAALAAAIIPISFLAALNALNDWISIIIVLSAAALGLLMKWLGWPRPPLILGFVLGSVIERNLQSAVSLYGWSGAFVRPITVVLLIILVATVYLLTVKFTTPASTSGSTPAPDGPPIPAGESWTGPSRYAFRMPRPTWGPDVWATFVVIAAMMWVLFEISDLPPRAMQFPRWLALGIIGLSALVIFRKWTIGDKQGEIMDIGMRSVGVEGALKRSIITAVALAILIVFSVLFGLILGSIIFAFIYPWVMMESKHKWLSGAITGVIIIVLSIFLFDHFMALWWPDAVIGDPLKGLVQSIIG